jgi:hypothetical protein
MGSSTMFKFGKCKTSGLSLTFVAKREFLSFHFYNIAKSLTVVDIEAEPNKGMIKELDDLAH